MKPIKTNSTNGVLRGSGDVADLHVTNLRYGDGSEVVESCWELSDEEVQTIARTKRVYFLCLGNTHPPMMLKTEPEVKE